MNKFVLFPLNHKLTVTNRDVLPQMIRGSLCHLPRVWEDHDDCRNNQYYCQQVKFLGLPPYGRFDITDTPICLNSHANFQMNLRRTVLHISLDNLAIISRCKKCCLQSLLLAESVDKYRLCNFFRLPTLLKLVNKLVLPQRKWRDATLIIPSILNF